MFTVSSKAISEAFLKSNGRKHSQECQGAWDEEMSFLWCSPRAGQELQGKGVEAADSCSMTQSIPAAPPWAFPHGDLQALLTPHITARGLHRTARQTSGCCSGPQCHAGWWSWRSVFSHHLSPHPLFPPRPQDPLSGQPYITQPYITQRLWQRELEAEQGKGTFITVRTASSLSLLNPATFALLNLGEYEKHSLRTGGGGGTGRLLASFNSLPSAL